MAKHINTLVITFVLWQVCYLLFGDSDSMMWSHVFYVIESGFVLYVLLVIYWWANLKKWILFAITPIYITRVVAHTIGFISESTFDVINKNYLLCLLLVVGVEICLILSLKK